eukprot:CAMPEP_0205822690 /NCGR_PEP_ID=MMETSP0206-20130828/13622_1 /ASSEMBLY_ACC=CAM_ASM_000279 /TAXON_ID=36767 /ORGANISM="Euplotes focardii, Strain TN1" /LENGTH=268 /DNA_ID=CAMNT_0053119185 /DNA_START=18 /DNA_END=821 /DNA_ORIENTATION=+
MQSCLFLSGAVAADDDGVVALVGLEGDLLGGLEAVCLELLDLARKDGLGLCGGVDAVGLDRDDEVAAVLEEVLRVEGDDAGLVGLGDVGEHHVDHADQHAVLVGVARVLDDGDDVGALLGQVEEVPAGPVRELHRVDDALRADHVGAVRDGGARGGAEVEELGAGLDVDVLHAADHRGGQLGAEGVPHAVLVLHALAHLDRDALLSVDRLARHEVLRHQNVLLALGDVDAPVPVLLDHHLGAAAQAAAASATASAASAGATAATASAT